MLHRVIQKRFRLVPTFERFELRQMLASDLAWSETALVPEGEDGRPLFYVAGKEVVTLGRVEEKIAVGFRSGESADKLLDGQLVFSRGVTEGVQVFASTSKIDQQVLSKLAEDSRVQFTVPVLISHQSNTEMVLLDEIIVDLSSNITPQEYFANRADVDSYRSIFGTTDQFIVKLKNSLGIETLTKANTLLSDPRLDWVSPNFYQNWQKFFIPNDPLILNQWHHNNTGISGGLAGADSRLFGAWDVNPGGSPNMVISVIDDGVQSDHPDLLPWVNPGEIAGDGIDNDGNGFIDDITGWNFVNNTNNSTPTTASDNHGTAVAGVAAARGNNGIGVAGASYRSPNIGLRMFAGSSVASDGNIAAALRYGATYGAVVNNSWGGGGVSSAINSALTWGVTNGRGGLGSTFLFATGNGFASSISYPASQAIVNPGVMAIGATNNRGERSNYSNFGVGLDLVTPSNDTRAGYLAIETTDRTGANGYSPTDYTGTGATGFGGTSSATPLASGIAALTLAQVSVVGETLSPIQLKQYLRNSTDLIGNEVYDIVTGFNNQFGQGRLNAQRALYGVGKAKLSVVDTRREYNPDEVVNFGNRYVGQNSQFTLRLRNQGTRPLDLTGLTIPAPFHVVSGFGDSQLTVGETTNITLGFTPTSPGNFSLTGLIHSNDPDNPNFRLTLEGVALAAAASGVFYEDFANDGARSPHDSRLSTTTFFAFIDSNSNNNFDFGEPRSFIDSTGFYSFETLTPGTYTIRTSASGWTSSGVTSHSFTIVDSSSSFSNLDFGFQRNSRAYALVFEDENLDGIRDSGEAGIPGLTVQLGIPANSNFTQNTPTNILDLNTVTSQLMVPLTLPIVDVNVSLRLTHTWMSDLQITLISPLGTRVVLADSRGGSADGYINTIFDDQASVSIGAGSFPFTGSFRPEQPLSVLNGISPNGIWQLEVADQEGGDVGVLETWSLQFTIRNSAVTNGDGYVGLDLPSGTTPMQLILTGAYSYTLPSDGIRNVNWSPNPINGLLYGAIFGNRPPFDISTTPSPISVEENRPGGTLLATLSTRDPNMFDFFVYTLPAGSFDNALFDISGNRLLTRGPLNFEAANQHTVLVRSTDSGGLFFEKTFVVNVTDVNEPATGIFLSGTSLPENAPAGFLIGTLSHDDPDINDVITFTLPPGIQDNNLFSITGGNQLVSAVTFDFEARQSYNILARLRDRLGLIVERGFVIQVTNVNERPIDIRMPGTTIAENSPIGTLVSQLRAVDPEGDPITWSLVAGSGDTNNADFQIVGNEIRSNRVFDFETIKLLSVRVRAADPAGLHSEESFVISTTNVNEAPTDLRLSKTDTDEMLAVGSTIAILSTVDPDVGDSFKYSLIDNANYPDNSAFTIAGNQLRNKVVFDFETKQSYVIRLRTTDLGGLEFDRSVTITINNVNDPPSDIGLTNDFIFENQPLGSLIGILSTVDGDGSDVFTYRLIPGTGSKDNARYSIVGDRLLTAQVFDFEDSNLHSIRIESRDNSGEIVEKIFSIRVGNVNEAPTNLTLSATTIRENLPSDTVIGNLSTSDPDQAETFTYTFAPGTGDADNGSFRIVGTTLRSATPFNFENKSSYQIRLRSSDAGGLFIERAFVINVLDINEPPTSISVQSNFFENLPITDPIALLGTNDPDANENVTFAFATGDGDNDNSLFTLSQTGQVRAIHSANFEARSSYTIRVRATDRDGLFLELPIPLSVIDVNEAPTSLTLSNSIINENVPIGTDVGNLSTTDEDRNEFFAYSFVSGSGDTNNSLFVIVGNSIRTLFVPNFEARNQYLVRIRSTDRGGLWIENSYTISIKDENERPNSLSLSNQSIPENQPSGTVVGILTTSDQDANDTFTYSLVSGAGDENNSNFAIVNNELRAAVSFNHEVTPTRTVRIRTTDQGGNFIESSFAIMVSNVNELPTIPVLSNSSIAENLPANSLVGTLLSTDEDANDPTQFLFVGTDNDNSAFTIIGNQLFAKSSFDFETRSTYSISVRAIDQSGTGPTASLTVMVMNVNESPTNLELSNTSLPESPLTGRIVGQFSVVDPENDPIEFTLSGPHASLFSIQGSTLILDAATNFEAQTLYELDVRAADPSGLHTNRRFNISITDVNESPTILEINNSSITENNSPGAVVGNFSTTDEDRGESFTYSLVSGDGSVGNSAFSIEGSALIANSALNFEANPSYSIRVRTTDRGGLSLERTFIISVNDQNEPPTQINLSNSVVPENGATNYVVGDLIHDDPDANPGVTFTLVSGLGSDDNALFQIVNSQLVLIPSVDFEATPFLNVRIRATDSQGLMVERALPISVLNLNEAPRSLQISHDSLAENNPANTPLAQLFAIDPDGDPLTFSLVPNAQDNAAFAINGSVLSILPRTNFELKNQYNVLIRASDDDGLFVEAAFTISILNVEEAPTGLSLIGQSVNENVVLGTTVGLLVSTDDDFGETFTYSLVTGNGSADNGKFVIVGNSVRTNAKVNFEVQSSYQIRLRTTDSDGLFFEQSFVVQVVDLPEVPPTANPDSLTTTVLFPSRIHVLANDSDSDSIIVASTLEIVAQPTFGTVSIHPDGSITYSPNANSVHSDQFSYRVRDTEDEWSNVAIVSVSVVSAFFNQNKVRNMNMDVNADNSIDPLDVLELINDINLNGSRKLETGVPPTAPFIDPNNDLFVDALDVLMIVNYLNELSGGMSGEGESSQSDRSMEPRLAEFENDQNHYLAVDLYFQDLEKRRRSR